MFHAETVHYAYNAVALGFTLVTFKEIHGRDMFPRVQGGYRFDILSLAFEIGQTNVIGALFLGDDFRLPYLHAADKAARGVENFSFFRIQPMSQHTDDLRRPRHQEQFYRRIVELTRYAPLAFHLDKAHAQTGTSAMSSQPPFRWRT